MVQLVELTTAELFRMTPISAPAVSSKLFKPSMPLPAFGLQMPKRGLNSDSSGSSIHVSKFENVVPTSVAVVTSPSGMIESSQGTVNIIQSVPASSIGWGTKLFIVMIMLLGILYIVYRSRNRRSEEEYANYVEVSSRKLVY
jgi:hypothetical protein